MRQNPRVRRSLRHPARIVPLGFLAAIAVGTGLLMLPIARAGEGAAPPLTALFTSTSAVSLTGLITVDTGTYWSPFGQVVILVLVQAGGFGIMTGASLLALLVARRLRLRDRMMTQMETRSLALGDVRSVIIRTAALTFTVEAAVALVLLLRMRSTYTDSWGEAAWNSVFHSVSAFTNGGFSPHADSFTGFVTDPVMCLPIIFAVIIGGIGFPVLADIFRRNMPAAKWSVHTKLTLLATAVLLVTGFGAYLALEWDNPGTLGPMGAWEKILPAFFSGSMPRTGGFNSIDITALRPETLAVTDVLMFIGGGSGGTAGGVKVTTFFLLAFVIWAEVRGEPDVSIFRRRISPTVQRQALTVALLGVAAAATGTVALLLVTNFPLDRVLFEALSAFGTVGLSTGITPQLNGAAQLVLIVLMYIGRVGTIAVATAMALRVRGRLYRYPEERPIVG